ncbi:MAG TPA: FecR domain-containing protein [Candidatus Acidoferrum sp.]|nr:FecR domain-containing protein [Candidatus Acidoferrum sp.]
MNDDYLWDGSGEPDPEIQKLESTLVRFRHHGETPEFPEITATQQPRFWKRFLPSHRSFGLVAATATILFIAAFGILQWSHKPNTTSGAGWDVESVAGTPRVESNAFGMSPGATKLGIGQTLITDSHSKANLSIADIGTVNVEPNTRLRSIAGGNGHNRLALDRGTIHAYIWASPGEFTVDTPSAIAVDLGCSYTLQVDDSGAGLLRTKLGWVGFKLDGHEAFIPAGAVCATRPKVGPGTPYFEDASASFREALSKFDFAASTPEEQSAELSKILAESRQRDALTVWHLLARVSESERGEVYDRLATLVPPPSGVTRDGILHLDQKMLDLWWNQLGLGDVSLWRTWERSWSPAKS